MRRKERMSKYNLDLLWNERLFNIEYKKYTNKDSMVETHYHTHYEMYYQLSGDRYYFIKDRTYHIKEGTLVWLNSEDIHKTLSANQSVGERILINFKRSFLSEISNLQVERLLKTFNENRCVLQLTPAQKSEVEQLLEKMMIENKREKDAFYNQLLFCELLSLQQRYMNEASKEEITPMSTSPKHERVAEVAQYLNENYSKKITLEDVAKAFYISPYYLSRTFKEGTGFNLINYLNYIRIKNAKILLDTTDKMVIDISHEVGFESTTHFDRVFKDLEGMTPLKYRKQKMTI